MADVGKSLIAAILAVRGGRLTPQRAVELVETAPSERDALVSVQAESAATHAGTVAISASLVEKIAKRLETGESLDGLGLDAETAAVLRSLAEHPHHTVRETLLSLAPTRAYVHDSDDGGLIDAADSEQPTQRPVNKTPKRKHSTELIYASSREDRYLVQREHARGGMGRILLARDHVVGRDVALKELLPSRNAGGSTPNGNDESRGMTERFLREAKVTGQLEHPNIVPVYEIGKDGDGSLYYTMRFVRGDTLAARLNAIARDVDLSAKGKLAARLKLLDSFVDVCNAIAYAHSKGIIHRDLKPENIMLGEYGETVLLDWGLARVRGQEDTIGPQLVATSRYMSQSVLESESANLTMDGSIVGTPAYMAPEQARGELDEIDEQTDVYALGAVLYQILCGKAPFEGPMPALIIQQVLNAQPLRLSAVVPEVPPELEALVERAMAKNKSDRLKSARDFAEEIKAFRDGRTLASYQYTFRELIARWMSRHRTMVLVGMAVFYAAITFAVFHYVQLRNEKIEVDNQRAEADRAKREAEVSFKQATEAENVAREQRDRAQRGEASAKESQKQTDLAMREARDEANAKQAALDAWQGTLGDAYAMRMRLATEERDSNSALAFAAASLEAADNPWARGGLLSVGDAHPLLWHLRPETPQLQELYQFFPVVYSPDGSLLCSGQKNGRIALWDAATGEALPPLQCSDREVFAVAFDPAGNWLVAGGEAGVLMAWPVDPDTRRPLADKAFVLREKGNRIINAVFSPDGSQLAICSEQLELYDVAARQFIGRFTGGSRHWASFAAWTADGRTIVTSSILPDDFFLRVWDVETLSFKRALLDTAGLNEMFVFASPDGRYIATSTMQGHLLIRDSRTLQILRRMTTHTSAVFGCSFSPDGSRLLSCSADGTVRLWNTDNGDCLQVFSGFPIWNASCAFAPDGSAMAVRDTLGDVRVWGNPAPDVTTVRGHTGDVVDVSICHAGKYLVSAGWDGRVIVRDALTYAPVREFNATLAQFFTAEVTSDSKLVAGGGSDGLRIFDGETGAVLAHTLKGEVVLDLHLLPGGKQVMALYYRQANIIDMQTGEKIAELSRHGQLALAMSVTQDGTRVATASTDGSVRIHDIATRELLHAFDAGAGEAYSLGFSPDGKLLAVSGGNRVIRVFDVATAALKAELVGHEGIVFGLAWSADGKWLYSSSQDRTVRLWEYESQRMFAVLRGHTETVTRLIVTPQGLLVTGSQDDTLRAWQISAVMGESADIVRVIRGITGMAVAPKSFSAQLDDSWPGERPEPAVRQRRRQAAELRRENSIRFQVQFEGYRYHDSERGGQKIRNYAKPRGRDASGRLMGTAPGKLNYLAWLAEQQPQRLAHLMESSAVITEVTSDGQAAGLGLKVGDVLYAAGDTKLTDREALRAAIEAAGDQPLRVTVRRFKRDEAGKPQPTANAEGDLLLDEGGNTRWDYTEFQVDIQPGKLGARIGEEQMLPRPAR